MMNSPFPENYEQWKHCITVECNIPLTPEFVAQRLKVWRDEKLEETARFRKLYGDQHWRAVIGWLEQAEQEVGSVV